MGRHVRPPARKPPDAQYDNPGFVLIPMLTFLSLTSLNLFGVQIFLDQHEWTWQIVRKL
jgi:hypothetical protein